MDRGGEIWKIVLKIRSFRPFYFVKAAVVSYEMAGKAQMVIKNISYPLVLFKWILSAVSLLEMYKNCDVVTGITIKNKTPKIKSLNQWFFFSLLSNEKKKKSYLRIIE